MILCYISRLKSLCYQTEDSIPFLRTNSLSLKFYSQQPFLCNSILCTKHSLRVEVTASKENTETEKIIATMFDILRNNPNVRVANLILDRSYSQTVENLFALSFLVKDGRVMISVDENDCHRVSLRNAPASGAIMSGKVAYRHFIFRFDFNDLKVR